MGVIKEHTGSLDYSSREHRFGQFFGSPTANCNVTWCSSANPIFRNVNFYC